MGSSIVASEQAGQGQETPYLAFRFRLVAGASGSAGATSGGVFHNDALVPGVNQAVPIDVDVPGCPPRPEQFIYAILTLQRKIEAERGSFRRTVNWS